MGPFLFVYMLNDKLEQVIAGPLVWLSTLHAAAEVIRGRAERSRGIDASEAEEPAEARRHLHLTVRELEELAFRLGALQSEVLDSVDELAGAVARFDELLVLNRCAQMLEDVHRRLLSLYPEAEAALIEEARLLSSACRDAVADDGNVAADDLFGLCSRIRSTCL